MGWFGFGRRQEAAQVSPARASAPDGGIVIDSSEALAEYLRHGMETESGAVVTPKSSLSNSAVFRAVNLTSNSMAMLPFNVVERQGEDVKRYLPDHPLAKALAKPNGWQTGFDFRRQLMVWLLVHGNAYAVPVRSGARVIGFLPIKPNRVTVVQNDDLSVDYRVTRSAGGETVYRQGEIVHLRDLSLDGVEGMSRVNLAREAIGLSSQLEKAAAKLFKQGVLAAQHISFPNNLGKEKREEIRAEIEAKYSGASNAGKWMVTDNGANITALGQSAADNQHLEERSHQVEEVARFFDIPRPLLMVDETAWGSGIEQLATLFVRGGLAPWFSCWEQAFGNVCFTEVERRTLYLDFDETELLRGSMKDQAEFFAKARGSGGSGGWLTVTDVRRATGYAPLSSEEEAKLNPAPQKGQTNVTP